MKKLTKVPLSLIFVIFSILILTTVVGSLAGCDKGQQPNIQIETEYKAVFMTNGQVFFGKLENASSPFPLVKDVFYIQNQVDPETNKPKGILIKRGNELHAPDVMYINSRHIVVIESVTPNSKVAQLIKDAKAQKPAGTQ